MSHGTVPEMRASTWFTKRTEKLRNKLIARHKTTIPLAGEARRFAQRHLTKLTVGVRQGHSHRAAATERNSATESMLSLVETRGFVPYVISPSPREDGFDGSRAYHSLSDLRQDYKDSKLTKNHMFVMTDVDYYVNMHELLSYGLPVLAYTFQPKVVSGVVKDGFFTIDDNVIHYRVNGGKDVYHRTWNYNQDTVFTVDPVLKLWPTIKNAVKEKMGYTSACSKLTKKFGVGPGGKNITISTIDQFALSDNRVIVSIVPFARCRSNLLPICDFGPMLEQTVYKQRGTEGQSFNAITHIGHEGPELSLGEEGQFASVTVPLKTFECLRTAFSLSKTTNLSDTVRRSKVDHHDAAILHKCVVNSSLSQVVEVHKPGQLARHYQSAEKKHDTDPYEQGSEYAREYAPGPLTQTAVFPNVSCTNERATIEGRIQEPLRKAKARENTTPQQRLYMREFVNKLVPEAGTGVPYSVAHVEALQQKPLQRARNDANRFHHGFDMIVKAFQKKEAYNAPNHPRNISTVPHGQNAQLSGYTYAFKDDILKKQSWYTPCKTPAEIAAAVQDLANSSDELVETDYSRFDGTFLDNVRQKIEFCAYRRWTAAEHKGELETLLSNEMGAQAVTKLGQKYRPESTRLSGSPLTTDCNSMANAFVFYATNRLAGQSIDEAWDNIGLVYGDDGLRNGTVTDALLVQTASDLGFDLQIVNRAVRGTPVSFLSRIFADPWSSPASIQSPLRTLLKIHTTCDVNVNIEEIGWAKTQAYLVTDGFTPFLSNWCRAYQRNCQSMVINYKDFDDIPFWVRTEASLNNSWPQSTSEIWLETVAKDLKISVAELEDHLMLLDEYVGPISGLPRLTTSVPLDPKLVVVLDGEVQAGPIIEESSVDSHDVSGQRTSDQQGSARATPALPGPSRPANSTRRGRGKGRKRNANIPNQRQIGRAHV